jgi:alanine racemase
MRTHVRVDLGRIAANYAALRAACPPDFELMAVVKANAYGHGALPVSQALSRAGCARFGVSSLEEGADLRANGVAGEIFVLSGVLAHEADEAARLDLTPMLHSRETYAAWREAAGRADRPLPCHLHVETGMNRLGLTADEAESLAREAAADGRLRLEGVCTHLASAEDFDDPQSCEQLSRFGGLLSKLAEQGVRPRWRHFANSAGLAWRDLSQATMARPGLALYGCLSGPGGTAPAARFEVQPALEWRAAVLAVKEVAPGGRIGYNGVFTAGRPLRTAVLGVGYGDGYRRELSGRGRVWLGGGYRPILGRISMDLTVVDVTEAPHVSPGDEAIVLGPQVPAEELAALCQTIPYEILCGISARAPRLYTD